MHVIDYEHYPILKEPEGPGRPTEKVHTPFGLLLVALANHLAFVHNRETKYPSDRSLARALFALPDGNHHRILLTRAQRYDYDAKRKTSNYDEWVSNVARIERTYRNQISRLSNHCISAANAFFLNQDVNPFDQAIEGDIVDHLYIALDYTLSTQNDHWYGNAIANIDLYHLLRLLRQTPINGSDDDEFSKAMCHVYQKVFGSVAPNRNDLTNCIGTVRNAWGLENAQGVEPAQELNASFEILRVIILGILFGPRGLDLYASKTDTPGLEEGSYRQVCLGFALTQLFDLSNEDNIECFSGRNRVELRRETNPIVECFSPKRRNACGNYISCGRVSDPHACIELINELDHEDGFTPRWRIRERENGTANGTAIRRVRDGIVGLLGEQAYELEDGDEIWLAPIIKGEDISPDYERGAVIRFQKVFDYQYTETDHTILQEVEIAVARDIQGKDTNQTPMGFSLCPLDTVTRYLQEAFRQTYYFAGLEDEEGEFEFTIGRDKAIANYSYGMGYEHISREHASITRSRGKNWVTLHEGTATNQMNTNGMEIVREGRIIPIGGKAPLKECHLRDGDVICFTSTRACFAMLSFSYIYEE